MNYINTLTKGIIKENPVFFALLGMCPTLALTTMAQNALGMGLATMFVLTCSNMVISILKKIIPGQVRLPCYIVVISGFVTFVSLVLKAFIPSLYEALGLFLSLITVNCIILGRAEVFASKNNVAASALDGLGMGIGFTLALFIMGSIREILGSGTWFGITLYSGTIEPMGIFILPAGGFFTLGIVIAAVNRLAKRRVRDISCDSCPGKSVCGKGEE